MSNYSNMCPAQPLKLAITIEEQIELLQSRGMLITDINFALTVLSRINYYRFSAYLLPFRDQGTGCYRSGTTFNKVYRIYEFDRNLRSVLMSAIEPIEILLKTKLAYYHAHTYGPEGYKFAANFTTAGWHSNFIVEFNNTIHNNRKTLFVKHHIEKYGKRFPVWVAVEMFSFGMLSKFFANMKSRDKKQIAIKFNTGPEELRSWLIALTDLRNRCAHYMRLYFHKIVAHPSLPNEFPCQKSDRIFDIIYIMKYLNLDQKQWRDKFIKQLEYLLNEYHTDIDLKYIGFPTNWLELLESSPHIKDKYNTSPETAYK